MTDPLPASPQIEQLILGSVLLDGSLMDALRATLSPEDFSLDRHRRVWAAMRRVYDAGATIEIATVFQNLSDHREDVGGLSFLVDLTNGVPQLPSLESYIGTLKEKAALRTLLIVLRDTAKRVLSGLQSSDELRVALGTALSEMKASDGESGPISSREMLDRHGMDALLRPRRTEGIRLPWISLNDVLCGLHPGQMITVAAGTGRGKTSFALQLATHATRQGKSPIIWTLEFPPERCFVRMVNQLAFANADRARQDALTPEERSRRKEAAYWLHGHPVWFDGRSRSVPAFCSSIRQARAKSDVGLVIVDYLQLIRFVGRAESRTREVGENSRSLKLAALELGLPFVVLSQFKRLDQTRDYTIHDLKESGDIENDSDVILIMNGPKLEGDREIPVCVTVGKQREGPTGNDLPLTFHPPSQSFYAPDERPAS